MAKNAFKEEKAKVGRPKLAEDDIVKKAKISIFVCLILCAVLLFSFVSIMNGKSPFSYAYELTLNKLAGMNSNPNGFMEKSYYDEEHNYVMEIKIPDSVDRYSGSYRYSTYYLKGNDWVKKDTIDIEKGARNIKIKLNSEKNKNITWKIKFQIVNGALVKESYAPFSWKFVDSKNAGDKYVYKILTVKGYYSPVNLSEINESSKNKSKINVSTTRKDPRTLNVNLPDGNYDLMVKYTDVSGKEAILSKDNNVSKKITYKVPNLEKSTKVTIMIWDCSKQKLDKKILSNWKIKEDKNGNNYATNYYVIKPEKNYEN